MLCLFWLGLPIQAQQKNSEKNVIITKTETPQPNKFLLQIGIDDYQYVQHLKGCLQDLEDLSAILVKRYGFNELGTNTKKIVNAQATRENILKSFVELIENVKKYQETSNRDDAIIVIQYSGHGSQITDINKDEGDGLDETIVPFDSRDLKGNATDITDDEIGNFLTEITKYSSNVLLILDSCHAGTATRGELSRGIKTYNGIITNFHMGRVQYDTSAITS